MSFSTKHIADLLFRSLEGILSDTDRLALHEWLHTSAHHRDLYADLHSEERLREQLLSFRPEEQAAVNQSILKQINDELFVTPAVHRIHFLKRTWFRYAAAILIIAGIGAYLWTTQQKNYTAPTAATLAKAADVPPGTQKAILTLSDGKKIELNNSTSETIHDQTLSIENNNGQLIYKKGELVAINTMTTPKGGQYQLTLADGTKVWLNAASSITYPTAFNGATREVTVTGEVYFEVTANKEKPFIVKTIAEQITVLGTSFNVNTYNDEPSSKISLSEGSIKINGKILKPGQAFINKKIIATNIAKDIAWKNGEFSFEDMDVKQAMRQLGRWYDVEVIYESEPPNIQFFGSMSRNAPLSTILLALEKSNVKLKLEGKKLIVR